MHDRALHWEALCQGNRVLSVRGKKNICAVVSKSNHIKLSHEQCNLESEYFSYISILRTFQNSLISCKLASVEISHRHIPQARNIELKTCHCQPHIQYVWRTGLVPDSEKGVQRKDAHRRNVSFCFISLEYLQYSVIHTDSRKLYSIYEKKKQQPPLSTISPRSVSCMGWASSWTHYKVISLCCRPITSKWYTGHVRFQL
jgi:hypothetical protein